jgi:hypothetical protein
MTTFARRQRPPYRGLDYQGRHPEAAERADDDLGPAQGILIGVVLALAAWLVIVLALIAAGWPA